jgi:drug/metabolite transporter (DMT)-like permease
VPGEITALISTLSYALSYLYLNRAQSKQLAPDNGLLPVLILSSSILSVMYMVHQGFGTSERQTHLMWKPIVLCVTAGVTWNFLGRMTLYSAISRIGATRGVVIKSVAPVITVILAVILLNEPIEIGDVVGFILMLLSIGLLVLERLRANVRAHFRTVLAQGILLGLVAACLQGIGHVLRKMGVESISPVTGATLDMTSACVAYILYAGWTGKLRSHIRFYRHHIGHDVIAAGILSAVGSLTFFVATDSAQISTVAMILGTQPIFMPIFSFLLFRGFERFSWLSYLSIVFVVLGMVCTLIAG